MYKCIYVFHMSALFLWRSEEDIKSYGTGVGVVGGCECSALIQGTVQQQNAFLTTDPLLQGHS